MAEPDGLHLLGHVGVPGDVGDSGDPSLEQLYITPEQLQQSYGFCATEGQIRMAQSLVDTTCCRKSLLVAEYTERLNLLDDRNQAILAVKPVVQLMRCQGRYSYGRRDRRQINTINYDYVAALAVFGSPPSYVEIDINQIDVNALTGELWLPTGFFLVSYSEIEVIYHAGYANIPRRAIAALIEIINTMQAKGVSDRTKYDVGQVHRTFANEGFVTKTAMDLLTPFIVHSLF